MPYIKKIWPYSIPVLVLAATFSCTEEINVNLPKAEPMLVVDALLSNSSESQEIILSQTQPYFEKNPDSILAVLDATVTVENGLRDRYSFTDPDRNGTYFWHPKNNETLGLAESIQTLSIVWEGQVYKATSKMNRVPEMKDLIKNEDGTLEFFATDLPGVGDIYRVKIIAYEVNDRGEEIKLFHRYSDVIYDASYRQGTGIDGVDFLPAMRQILDYPQPSQQNTTKIYVGLHALTPETSTFLSGINEQQRRTQAGPTGSAFASFFAEPPFNVYSNISNIDPKGKKAVGLFSVSNVSSKSIKLD